MRRSSLGAQVHESWGDMTMRSARWRVALCVAAIALAACGTACSPLRQPTGAAPRPQAETAAGAALEPGVSAPDFTLDTTDGHGIHLHDTRGKVVVLNFWASWCVPCREEMPLLDRAYRADPSHLLVIGVNATVADTQPEATSLIQTLGITFPIALDRSGEVMAAYGVQGLPATFVIDANGVIRQRHLGAITESMLHDYVSSAATVGTTQP
jgi:peroxiredoxin